MKCDYCRHENPESELYCANCGMKLGASSVVTPPEPTASESEGIRCEKCGFVNIEGASVCQGCNKPLVLEPAPEEPILSQACAHCGFDKNPEPARFCMSCGAQLPAPEPEPAELPAEPQPVAKLVILPTMKEISISENEITIGREDFIGDISSESAKYISREHLKITCENGVYYILDEGSTNGTTLNSVNIKGQGRRELNDNDEVVLADVVTVKFQLC